MSEKILVHCWSNQDHLNRYKWPSAFAARPMIGDRVRSEQGIQCKIVSITHVDCSTWPGNGNDKPYLSIELQALHPS